MYFHLRLLLGTVAARKISKGTKKRQALIEEDQVSVEVTTEVEAAPPVQEKDAEDGERKKPLFAQKLQDSDVVEGSAARMDVIVTGTFVQFTQESLLVAVQTWLALDS